MPWLYITVVLLMRIVQSVFIKTNSKLVPKNSICYLKYTSFYIGCASIPAFILFIINGTQETLGLYFGQTLIYASISGVALAITCFCSLYALSSGTIVLSSLFGTAGLIVPSIAGIFLYNEHLSVWQYIAIIVFILGAYFLVGNSKTVYGKFSIKTLFVLLINLIMNGVTMLAQTMFARNLPEGNVSLFSFLSFFSGVVVLAIVLLLFIYIYNVKGKMDNKTSEKDFVLMPSNADEIKLPSKVFLGATFLAIAVFLINQLVTLSAGMISPIVLFSITNGGATIISAVVGAVMYKEKFTTESVLGIVLGVGALILIKLFAI